MVDVKKTNRSLVSMFQIAAMIRIMKIDKKRLMMRIETRFLLMSGGYLVTTFTSSKCYSLDVFSPARQREPPSKQSEVLTKTLNR